jgi:hypothetical protein
MRNKFQPFLVLCKLEPIRPVHSESNLWLEPRLRPSFASPNVVYQTRSVTGQT